jgi:hypothetical protein
LRNRLRAILDAECDSPDNAAVIALLSVWIALGCLLTAVALVFWRGPDLETVLTVLPYTVALSVTLAAAVLWGLRKDASAAAGVAGRRLQAVAAIALNSLTFAILLVLLHGVVDAAIGIVVEFAYLAFVYWFYTRVLVREDGA